MPENQTGVEFQVSVSARQGGGSVVTVFGDLDVFTAPALKDALKRATDEEGEVELDMRACTFVDSMGIATLVSAARRLHEDGRTLLVKGARERVRNIFELAGLSAQRWIAFEDDDPA